MYTELALKCTRIFKLLYAFSKRESSFYGHLLCRQPLVPCVPQQLTCKIKGCSSLKHKVSAKTLSCRNDLCYYRPTIASITILISVARSINEASLMDNLLSWIVLPSRRRPTKFQGIYFTGETKNHG
jgi:hypothetical protein